MIILFFLSLSASSCLGSDSKYKSSDRHVATDDQMVIRQDDGGVRSELNPTSTHYLDNCNSENMSSVIFDPVSI